VRDIGLKVEGRKKVIARHNQKETNKKIKIKTT
jgi:hypothetical protein